MKFQSSAFYFHTKPTVRQTYRQMRFFVSTCLFFCFLPLVSPAIGLCRTIHNNQPFSLTSSFFSKLPSISNLIQQTSNIPWKRNLQTFINLEKSLYSGTDLSKDRVILKSTLGMKSAFEEALKSKDPKFHPKAQLGTQLVQDAISQRNLSFDRYMDIVDIYMSIFRVTDPGLRGFIREKYEEHGLIALPLRGELTDETMNQLWAAGILPLGLVEIPTDADGSRIDPNNFYWHDRDHANRLFFRLEGIQSILQRNSKDPNFSPPPISPIQEIRYFYHAFIAIHDKVTSPVVRNLLQIIYFKIGHEMRGEIFTRIADPFQFLQHILYHRGQIRPDFTKLSRAEIQALIWDPRNISTLMTHPYQSHPAANFGFSSLDLQKLSASDWPEFLTAYTDIYYATRNLPRSY